MSSRWLRWALIAMVASFGVKVFAHARLKANGVISPRVNAMGVNDPGVKVGPCGGFARLAPTVFAPGSTINLAWEETIDHPGRFEFYFSTANDANFQLLKTVNDDQNAGVALPHQYTTTVTLPNVTCTDCTLQMIQVMTEVPASPSYYYSCTDIRLQAGAPAPTPVPTPVPTPQPTPQPNCKP